MDIWDGREHIWDLGAKRFPSDDKERKRWAKKMIRKLNTGRVDVLISELRHAHTQR